MKQQTITIINKLGLHIRAANVLVSAAQRFSCNIKLSSPKKTADAKSIMDILLLGAGKGTELTLTTDGNDEDEAMTKIVEVINNRFGEAE